MVEGIGNGRARRYMLSRQVYALSGNETGYARQRGSTTDQEMKSIKDRVNKDGKITRAEVEEECNCNTPHANYLLQLMIQKNQLEMVKNGRKTYYIAKTSNVD